MGFLTILRVLKLSQRILLRMELAQVQATRALIPKCHNRLTLPEYKTWNGFMAACTKLL
jgi:hypothetical protein